MVSCDYPTAAMAGLRQSELRGLRWEHVDFDAGRIRVEVGVVRGRLGSTKSRKARSVPMATEVAAALLAWRNTSDTTTLVFTTTGEPLARTPLMRRYRTALAAAGLDAVFRFHDLRHTFGTTCAAAGVDAFKIQSWMGHSSVKTTRDLPALFARA